jgi:nucleotide-binding universal stress UspA family protein
MMSGNISLAMRDFRRARRRAKLQEIMAYVTGQSAGLLSYEEVRQKLKAREVEGQQIKEIPLKAIVGSVGRYNDFTRSFLPRKDSDETRWARVKTRVDLMGLPLIDVYQIDQAYFVLDGNHRVSIARQIGATTIQARVIEVQTKVPLSPDVRPDELIVKAEYADFLERTHLDELRPGANLSLTVPGRYLDLETHIEAHRYFMSLDQKGEVPYAEALVHWYDEAYLPVVQVIRERGILWDFPGRTETDLYLWLLKHRAELEKELGWDIDPEAAAADFVTQFSPKPRRVVARVSEKILDAVTPGVIEAGPPPGQWRRERLVTRRVKQHLFADVLVAINGETSGWGALEYALFIARHEKARVHGLHVVPSKAQKKSEDAQAVLVEFNRRCEAAGIAGKMVIESGETSRRICRRARWADLVVLSLEYPPAPQPIARLSSELGAIIRGCPRPTLAIPETAPHLHRALLAYDGSPKSEEALFVAAYLTVRWNIPLVVVTVMEKTGRTTAKTLARAQRYLEQQGGQATFVTEPEPIAEAIMKTVEEQDCDFIIMGGYGYSPVIEIVLGSTVDRVLRTSRRPILICR